MGLEKEQENSKIIRMPDLDFTPDPRGIGYVYYHCMLKNKDKLAQIDGLTGKRETYGDLLRRCVRTAIVMRKRGITPADFISLCSYNHLDSSTPHIASYFIGAKMAAVDPTLSLEETVHLFRQAPPKLIFVVPDSVSLIEDAIKETGLMTEMVVFGNTVKHTPFSEFLQPSLEENTFKPIEVKSLKDMSMMLFSSGTTGMAKGIRHDHYSILCQNENMIRCGFCYDLTVAYSSPYRTVFVMFLGTCVTAGAARVVFPEFDPNNAWKMFEYKPTAVYLNAFQIAIMCKLERPKNIDLSNLKVLFFSGVTIAAEQILKIKEMFAGINFHIMYGQSEIPGTTTVFKPSNPNDMELMPKKPNSIGTGMPGISYKIVDPETEEILGANQQGELRLKTEFQLIGYHNVDSSEVWDSDGWLKTGDVAYYDEDKCFYIIDRIKEMFKYQSWHIVPAVIENVLRTHPGIENAVVIGAPHEVDCDRPLGIVILKAIHKNVTPKEIEKYVEERVADHQRLRAGVKIVSSFPTNLSGKINRRKLREMFREGKL